jgi:hypothetical protein
LAQEAEGGNGVVPLGSAEQPLPVRVPTVPMVFLPHGSLSDDPWRSPPCLDVAAAGAATAQHSFTCSETTSQTEQQPTSALETALGVETPPYSVSL